MTEKVKHKPLERKDAVLYGFGGVPLPNKVTQARPAGGCERWREMTAWVRSGGAIVVIGPEAEYASGGPLTANPLLQEVHDEIGQLASLEEDWNDEGASAIDRASILHAQKFVVWLASQSFGQHGIKAIPSVFPTIDGGVQLYWSLPKKQVALTFRPKRHDIDYAVKESGEPSSRNYVPIEQAGEIALRVMHDGA